MIALTKSIIGLSAFLAVAVPIIYAFSNWTSSQIGKVFMLERLSFALGLGGMFFSVVFDEKAAEYSNIGMICVFFLILISQLLTAFVIFDLNYKPKLRTYFRRGKNEA